MHTVVEAFKRRMSKHLRIQLDIVVNENRSTMLNILDRRRNWARVSLHRIFLDAPENVISALAHYVRGTRPEQHSIIRGFIQNNLPSLNYSHRIDTTKLVSKGHVYDLEAIYHELNEKYFNRELNLRITWFGQSEKKPRTRITFGLYQESLKLIKIHRLLDNPFYPEFFVKFVVYHEMLHDIIPTFLDEKGLMRSHGKEFKMKEREYLDYERAKAWEKSHRDDFFEK